MIRTQILGPFGSSAMLSAGLIGSEADDPAVICFEGCEMQEAPVVDSREERIRITSYYELSPTGGAVGGLSEAVTHGLIRANGEGVDSVTIRLDETFRGDARDAVIDMCEGIRVYLALPRGREDGRLINGIDGIQLALHKGALAIWENEFEWRGSMELTALVEGLAALRGMREVESMKAGRAERLASVHDANFLDVEELTRRNVRVERIRGLLDERLEGFARIPTSDKYLVILEVIQRFSDAGRINELDDEVWDNEMVNGVLFFGDYAFKTVEPGKGRAALDESKLVFDESERGVIRSLLATDWPQFEIFGKLSRAELLKLARKILQSREDIAGLRAAMEADVD